MIHSLFAVIGLLLSSPASATPPSAFVAALEQAGPSFSDKARTSSRLAAPSSFEHLWSSETAMVQRAQTLIGAARQEILLLSSSWDERQPGTQALLSALSARARASLAGSEELLTIRLVVGRGSGEFNERKSGLTTLVNSIGANPRAVSRINIEWSQIFFVAPASLRSETLIVDGARALLMSDARTADTDGSARQPLILTGEWTGAVAASLRQDWFSARAEAKQKRRAPDGPLENQTPATDPSASVGLEVPVSATTLSQAADARWWARTNTSSQQLGVRALINATNHHLEIINPSLGSKAIVDALVEAICKRNVTVELLLNYRSRRPMEVDCRGQCTVEDVQTLMAVLLEKGGHEAADRLDVAWASSNGHDLGPGYRVQAVNFDDQCFWLGSVPFDSSSWHHARSVSVASVGAGVAKSFSEEVFAVAWDTAIALQAEHLTSQSAAGLWPRRLSDLHSDPVVRYLRHKKPRSYRRGP